MKKAKTIWAMLLALAAWPLASTAQQAQTTTEEEPINDRAILAGDIVTGLMPILAFGKAWLGEDTNEGMKQWMRSTAIDEIVLTAARVGFNQTSWGERPNGNGYGFPSGHAGFLYSQTAFLQYRYGWKWGVPTFIVATGVNYIRVREHKHYWRDVIAAGGLSYGLSLLTVTPEDATHLGAVVGPDWLGIRFERSF